MDVYEFCPQFEAERFLFRQTLPEDCGDLLAVYSDPQSWPVFNADNCTGDFRITDPDAMLECILFWQREYELGYYVRWSILDKTCGKAIGTVELFRRSSQDYFDQVGLLRLDLRSDYETEDTLRQLVTALIPRTYTLFSCTRIATKIPPCAKNRLRALTALGFRYCPEKLVGHGGKTYGDYFLCDGNP